MKMKNHWLKGMTAIMMVIAGMITTSCDTESELDVTNPNQAQLDETWFAKFGDIDPDQDWNLASSAKGVVSVYGIDALSDYQLQLFTDNPLTSENALLMASKKVTTDVNGNASASFDPIDVVKGRTLFYAAYMDRNYRINVKPVTLNGGIINAQFGKPKSRASENSDALVPEDVDSIALKNEVMANYSVAKEVSSSNVDQNWSGSSDFAQIMKISSGSTWTGGISVLSSNSNYGGYARTLYVEGTWTLSGEQKLGGGGLVVVCKGGKINIPAGSSLKSDNGGRIVVLSGGSVQGQGLIEFANGSGNSYNYNAGTINIGTMNNNGGTVYNYGTLTINELQGGAGKSIYINRNKMYVDHSTYGNSSANTRIYTCCTFEVKNDLCCRNLTLYNPSYAHIEGDLRVSCSGDGTNDPVEIALCQNAHLDVDGGVALNNASIVGPTEGWAICEFGQIGDPENMVATNFTTTWDNGVPKITEGAVINNLYVSIDKTETIDNYYNLSPYGKFTLNMMNGQIFDVSSTWNPETQQNDVTPVYRTDAQGNVIQAGNGATNTVVEGQAPIYIPAGDCGVPEYTGANGAPTTPQPQTFIIACEDVGATDDIDFNDVVFSVGHTSGENKMTITPLAAGGTLKAEIYYDETPLGEIHGLLGGSNTEDMINTETYANTGESFKVDVPADWSFNENYKRFKVKVTSNGGNSRYVTFPETTGVAPFIIAVPNDWQWPRERISIENAYTGFKAWSQDSSVGDGWLNTRVSGMTINR